MNKTALMVKEMAFKPELTVLTDHEKRMEKVLSREVVKREAVDKYADFVEACYELGFRVIVKPEFALKFRYGASILGNCVGRLPPPPKVNKGGLIIANGSSWVVVSSDWVFAPQRLTVRVGGQNVEVGAPEPPPSYPYPPELTEVYHYAGDMPDFVLDRLELVQKNFTLPLISVHSQEVLPIMVEKVPRRIEPVAILWADNPVIGKAVRRWECKQDTVGAVIAIWDRDKEIEILEG